MCNCFCSPEAGTAGIGGIKWSPEKGSSLCHATSGQGQISCLWRELRV